MFSIVVDDEKEGGACDSVEVGEEPVWNDAEFAEVNDGKALFPSVPVIGGDPDDVETVEDGVWEATEDSVEEGTTLG